MYKFSSMSRDEIKQFFTGAVLAFIILSILLLVYYYYRKNESFVSLMGKAEYFILTDLIKTFDKEMKSIREEWYMCCGNVLGYCRHGGPIPWDDDFDLCVSAKAYNTLLVDLRPGLLKRGYDVVEVRKGLLKFFALNKGKYVAQNKTRWPFLDVFLYNEVKDGGPELKDKEGNICQPGMLQMTPGTTSRCVERSMIFPTRRVPYKIPFYGVLQLPVPNKPGAMVAMIYGPGALVKCVGRFYNHDLEKALPFGGTMVDCSSLSESMGIKVVNNCEVPGLDLEMD